MKTKPEGGKQKELRDIIRNLEFGQEVNIDRLLTGGATGNAITAARQVGRRIYIRPVDGELHVRLRSLTLA